MAFARSTSGPGGLSINTNSANSLIGSGTQPPAAGGMFGNSLAKPTGSFGASLMGGGLFGNSAVSQPAQTSSVFGASQPAKTGGIFASTIAGSQPAQSSSMFAPTNATSQSAQTSNMFGSVKAAPGPAQTSSIFGLSNALSQPTQTNSVFGTINTSSQPAQTNSIPGSTNATSQPAQTSNMFGSVKAAQPSSAFATTNPNTQPSQQNSVFGTLNGTPQATQASSLFGPTNTTSQSTMTGGLLGSSQPGQTTAPTSLFQQEQPKSSLFSGGISQPLGSALNRGNQPTQIVPGVRIDVSNIRGTTRFNDLQEDLQRQLERMDEIIQTQIEFKKQCDAIMPSHNTDLNCIPPSVDVLKRQLVGLEDALALDATAIAQARELVIEDAEHAKISFKILDNLKLPPQYHNPNLWSSKASSGVNRAAASGDGEQDLVDYFSSTADDMRNTLTKYHQYFSEIENHLRTLEATSAQQVKLALANRNGNASGLEDPVKELGMALVEFEESLLNVASKVGNARHDVQQLQLGTFMSKTDNNPWDGKRSGIY